MKYCLNLICFASLCPVQKISRQTSVDILLVDELVIYFTGFYLSIFLFLLSFHTTQSKHILRMYFLAHSKPFHFSLASIFLQVLPTEKSSCFSYCSCDKNFLPGFYIIMQFTRILDSG